MNIKNLKPIPKAIIKKITNIENRSIFHCNGDRFYSYLTTLGREMVKVTVAVRYDRSPELRFKQVAVHGLHDPQCMIKDIEYNSYLFMGFQVGWHAERITHKKHFEDGKWYPCEAKYYDPWAPCVNLSYLAKTKYKYCGYKQFIGKDILSYLRIYEQYPQAEYLMKLGYHKLAHSTTILKKVAKDKAFRKWLCKGKERCDKFNRYSISTVLKYYKTGVSMEEIETYNDRCRDFWHEYKLTNLYQAMGNELKTFFAYIDKQEISFATYNDYFTVCEKLGLDMNEPKNRYPHDFMRWHDIRIDEWNKVCEELNRKEQEEQLKKFITVAKKYLPLQKENSRDYVTVIPKTPTELVQEGEALHHCVGRMNYDRKFAREETLIFFIRQKSDTTTPFVTVEYSLKNNKILQVHGDHNRKPEQPVLDYIYKSWLPFANKQIKQIKEIA